MAQQELINLEPMLNSRTKINENFTELYANTERSRVFAYMSSSIDTVMTTADSWYILKGGYTNEIVDGFSLGTTGIVHDGVAQTLEAEYMTGGQLSQTGNISIGLVKNGTFDANGKLETGSILPGSGGLDEATTISAASGYANPRGLWAGVLDTDDEITIVISSTVAGATWSPTGGSASIHRFN